MARAIFSPRSTRFGNDPPTGAIIVQETFGASAPWHDIAERFGYTAEAILARARELLGS